MSTASLFEHCARGLDQCLALTGANGLPLMGTGDWNDGMNRVGEGRRRHQRLARLVAGAHDRVVYAPMPRAATQRARRAGKPMRQSVLTALEASAWDGEVVSPGNL